MVASQRGPLYGVLQLILNVIVWHDGYEVRGHRGGGRQGFRAELTGHERESPPTGSHSR